MLRQSFDYRKWIGLDIGVVTHHVGRVGPHCSRPAYPRHIAQALQPRFERRTFGDMSNLHKPFVWSRHWNPGFRQPPGELSHAAKRCLAPKETRYALYQRRLLPNPGSSEFRSARLQIQSKRLSGQQQTLHEAGP